MVHTRDRCRLNSVSYALLREAHSQQMKKFMTGRSPSEATLVKMRGPRKPLTEEHKANLRKPKIRVKKRSLEASLAQSAGMMGHHVSDETKEKLRQSNLGKHHRKLRDSEKARISYNTKKRYALRRRSLGIPPRDGDEKFVNVLMRINLLKGEE